MSQYIQVAIQDTTLYYDKLYTYAVPAHLEGHIFVGSMVLCPFGRGKARPRVGLVLELSAGDAPLSRVKEILDAAPADDILGEEMLAMLNYLKQATFCTWFEALSAVLPYGAQYRAVEEDGFWQLQNKLRRTTQTIYRLTKKAGEEGRKVSTKQAAVLRYVEDNGPSPKADICEGCGVGTSVADTLVRNGFLEATQEDKDIEVAPSALPAMPPASYALNEEQQAVFEGLKTRLETGSPKPCLLYGVTGSGKTALFLELARQALAEGKTALILVPEIGLTPQMIDRLRGCFGPLVAVQHSGLSHTQRLLQWRAIRRGEARVVVGTRSAVFAPLEDIGLIVIDEEQERSYQSESAPRYDATEVAKRRAQKHGALLLLASATPSVASYHAAQQGRYELFTLEKRYNDLPLPAVEMVDMHDEMLAGNPGSISHQLAHEITATIEEGGQVILLLNRRGYHRVGRCKACGEIIKCSDCSVPMIYHRVGGGDDFLPPPMAPQDAVEAPLSAAKAPPSTPQPSPESDTTAQSGEAAAQASASAAPASASAALPQDDAFALWQKIAPKSTRQHFGQGGGTSPAPPSIPPQGAPLSGPPSAPPPGGGPTPAPGTPPPPASYTPGDLPGGTGRLLCHYCGKSIQPAPSVCPTCGGEVHYYGFGTQRVEEELEERFKGARILRMDTDTTGRKDAHSTMLAAFGRGEYDIMIGTQMVAKGLDFERVGLVGVIGIDSLLFSQGYRAFEHVFSLVTQVVGRAGRAGRPGHALIQTMDPENPVLTLAARQDYPAFYEQEVAFRRMALYPPWCAICLVGFVADSEQKVMQASRAFAGLLAQNARAAGDIPLRVLGPAPMSVAQVAGAWRWRLTLKCRADAAFRALVTKTLEAYNADGWPRKASVYLDFNADATL